MLRTPFPDLDRDATASLASQIAGYYAEAIRGGQLRAGERLPPTRQDARGRRGTRARGPQA